MATRVLVTGAGGRIGSALVRYLEEEHSVDMEVVQSDVSPEGDHQLRLDITDFDACAKAMTAADVVVHLAGVASPATAFAELLQANILGTYNVFEAARSSGVKRVVYASSAQAVEGYPIDHQVHTHSPVRPKNLYGVSKAFGEALGAYFGLQTDLEVLAIRIGAFEYPEEWTRMGARDLSAWIHPHDMCELIAKCIDIDLAEQGFAIVHGISDNRFKRLDLSDTRALTGYQPAFDAFRTWGVDLPEKSETA